MSTKHMYEVIEDTTEKVEVGEFVVKDGHTKKEDEPERVWHILNVKTGEESHIIGKHIGEYEKVKEYARGYGICRDLVAFADERGYLGASFEALVDQARDVLGEGK